MYPFDVWKYSPSFRRDVPSSVAVPHARVRYLDTATANVGNLKSSVRFRCSLLRAR